MTYVDIQTDEELGLLSHHLPEQDLPKEAMMLVKTANVEADYSDLIKEAFADQKNQMFPIHTPGDTILSAVYINSQLDSVPELTKKACREALEEWNIEGVIIGEMEKTASTNEIPDDHYLLEDAKKLPVLDDTMLIKSAAILSSNFDKLTIDDRVNSSLQLRKFATMYGVDMTAFDSKFNIYSLQADCNLGKLAFDIGNRMTFIEEEERAGYREVLAKLASLKEELGGDMSTSKETNAGIAHSLITLDKTAGIYGTFNAIEDTYNTVSYAQLEGLSKVASLEVENLSVGGYEIPLVKIASMPEDLANTIFAGMPVEIVDDGGVNVDNLQEALANMTFAAQNTIGEKILAI